MSADLFGYVPAKPKFTDIANQRDSVAEEKAILCKQLGELVNKAPPLICNADVKTVREWRAQCDRARKILGNKRSSRNDLTVCIKQMRSYYA